VVAITVGAPQRPIARPTQRHGEDLRAFENACSRAGLGVRLAFYLIGGPRLEVLDPPGLRFAAEELASVLGFALFTRGLPVETVGEALRTLALYNLPVAVLDDTDAVVPRIGDFPSDWLRVFAIATSSLAGEVVARSLLGLGHRRLAYVGIGRDTAWCRRRHGGVVQVMRAAGVREEVPYLSAGVGPRLPLAGGEGRGAVASMRAALDPSRRAHSLVARALDQGAMRAVENLLSDAVRHEELLEGFGPVARGLLQSPRPTAVVCANDSVAWACVEALRSRGVRVPEDLSVAGFDDTFEAFQNGLTSYNFNSQAAAQAMLNHILRPPRGPRRHHAPRVVEIEGFVNLRGTTGPAAPK
jgi:DNA-binding LacI/PurR family transcriptional regulator